MMDSVEISIDKSLSQGDYSTRKKILLEWIPNLYRGGATPSFVQRHVVALTLLLHLSVLPTYLPGRVILTVSDKENPEHSETTTLAVSWGFNMGLLEDMDNFLAELVDGVSTTTLYALSAKVEVYNSYLPFYSPWMVVFAFGVLSGTMAFAFFGGNWADALITFLLGLIAGTMVALSDYKPASFNILHELIASFIISFLAIAVVAILPIKLHYWPMVLAGTIWILPGFSMVIGMVEIVRKFTLAGFVQHGAALFVSLIMGLGYGISYLVSDRFIDVDDPAYFMPNPEMTGMRLIFSSVLTGCFAASCSVIYQSPPRHFPLSVSAAIFSFLLSFATDTCLIPIEVSSYTNAILVTLYCRVFGGLISQISLSGLFVAVLPLVPGSRVVRSAFALLYPMHNVPCALTFAQFYQSILISMAVAFGIFTADLIHSSLTKPYLCKPFCAWVRAKKLQHSGKQSVSYSADISIA